MSQRHLMIILDETQHEEESRKEGHDKRTDGTEGHDKRTDGTKIGGEMKKEERLIRQQ